MSEVNQPSIEGAFKKTFNEQLNQIVPVVANTIIALFLIVLSAITIIGLLLIPAIWGGYILSITQISRGENVKIGKFLSSGFNRFGAMLGAMIIVCIGVVLGLLCFIIPGIYLMVRWVFVPYIIMNTDCEISDAFRISGEMVNGRWWEIFVMFLCVEVIEGMLTWTGIGIILGTPFGAGVTAQYYLALSVEELME